MKDVFACFGFCVAVLWILGATDIGHFRLYYGDDKHGCTKMEEKLNASGED